MDDLTRTARDLARRHPSRCRLRQIGESRAGEPLWLLSVGHGSRNVLVVSGAHPNEPAGGAAVAELAYRAVRAVGAGRAVRTGRDRRQDRDVAWHFLLCLDPDGARRTEPWTRHPGTLERQLRHFYRPAADQQPEWLPGPGGAAPLPETRALLTVLDELRPALQFSLHANDAGGAWVQLTHDLPGAPAALSEAAAGLAVPVAAAPVDTLHMPGAGPGVFLMAAADGLDANVVHRDWLTRSTWFHPLRYGTVTAVVETPVWAVEAVADPRPTGAPHLVVAQAVAHLRARADRLAGLLAEARGGLGEAPGPLLDAAAWLTEACFTNAAQWSAPPTPGGTPPAATAGGALALHMAAHRLPLRAAALLARATGGHPVGPAAEALLTRWRRRYAADFGPRWIPVRRQTTLQTEFVSRLARLALGAGRHPGGSPAAHHRDR
ncbi:M14 family zinc carboxypeptidase [Streptomyces sp. WMMC500]|uniref:M14 family zinc carboxypeptidase n=1 Tax=Streptomyces sp. WMMC500 TaxID=3015154 RepID=UPI00248B4198|nr:M14 family zinc carboxypeptidase [Streptomyces sp. WMMC500]WBB59158.1 M14 family zinc carboxypeptidase [Streptomyces sp. WMMC500]